MIFTKSFWKHKELNARINVSQGGTSSGKTYSTLQLLYFIANNKDKLLISIVSESMPHLKRGAMRDFFNILKENDLYIRDNHNKTDNTYQVNNSVIEFFSVDNHAKLRGARRDILFINECNNVSYEAFNQLEVRTKKRVYLDFNPVSSFWAHEKVLTRDDTAFLKTTYLDNDALAPEIIKSIEARKSDVNWWRVYGLGEVGMLEGLVLKNFGIVDSMPTEYKWKAYGQDFGFTNDPSALIDVTYANGELWLDEIIYETGLTNSDLSTKYAENGLLRRSEIIADSAEPKSIEEIHRMGWFIKPAHKGKDSILNGIDILKRYKINITKRSTNLIKEFRNYTWQVDKDGNHINKPIDYYNHGIDAVRYVALNKIGKPKFRIRA